MPPTLTVSPTTVTLDPSGLLPTSTHDGEGSIGISGMGFEPGPVGLKITEGIDDENPDGVGVTALSFNGPSFWYTARILSAGGGRVDAVPVASRKGPKKRDPIATATFTAVVA